MRTAPLTSTCKASGQTCTGASREPNSHRRPPERTKYLPPSNFSPKETRSGVQQGNRAIKAKLTTLSLAAGGNLSRVIRVVRRSPGHQMSGGTSSSTPEKGRSTARSVNAPSSTPGIWQSTKVNTTGWPFPSPASSAGVPSPTCGR